METAKEIAVLELPLGEAAESFSLEGAVCSHGLFMMPPNRWDPLTCTFSRPLRRLAFIDAGKGDEDDASSVMVRISHPPNSLFLQVVVYGDSPLSSEHRKSLLNQVKRMLRLSEVDERNAQEFRKLCQKMEASECVRNFRGRVFRSPTLFEDMVKCILLCNCQWSRTLSMANALCELQYELHSGSSNHQDFVPKTPAALKESKRTRLGRKNVSISLSYKFSNLKPELKVDSDSTITEEGHENKKDAICERLGLSGHNSSNNSQICEDPNGADQFTAVEKRTSFDKMGNFPSPRELASLDERFLAKRCNLGYRASRVLKLSRDVVEGKIQLREMEEACDRGSITSYTELMEQLKKIDGFGPFTCANVLMCMGFFHVIPTDSETIRHLKQVHARRSTLQTVQRDLEEIYGKYEPFQFLTYWAEIWNFYEQTFGKLSTLRYSDYKLITATNMKTKRSCRTKRTKLI